jgi:LPPG:FO 2-phospho-L-lactate transferase
MNGPEVVALTGGVGGAKLALGLAQRLPDARLACIVNTADDFVHLGLHISPDLDTLLYTLAGCAHPEQGWGRRDETWTFMRVLESLGGPSWFRLGDGDLALHVERTRRLASGATLTLVMNELAQRLGVGPRLMPMSDDAVRTRLTTDEGVLDFQDYFVARRAAPRVRRIEYAGSDTARPSDEVLRALATRGLRAIVICPSNPYLSIDPILSVPGLRERLRAAAVPIVAVSPLIGGRAVKGPTAKLMQELGVEPTPEAIALHYRGLIDGLVLDEADRSWAARCGIPTLVTPTLMRDLDDRRRLAEHVLEFAARITPGTANRRRE